jgi:hypothetical protein
VLQFLLGLSDRQAAEAVRCRIDFKYAMAMELEDPGFHHSVLADFRDRLAEDDRTDRLLDLVLARLKEAGLVRERTTQRTDSTHVLAAVRDLTRLELVTEAVRAALEEVVGTSPHLLDELVARTDRRVGDTQQEERAAVSMITELRHSLITKEGCTCRAVVLSERLREQFASSPCAASSAGHGQPTAGTNARTAAHENTRHEPPGPGAPDHTTAPQRLVLTHPVRRALRPDTPDAYRAGTGHLGVSTATSQPNPTISRPPEIAATARTRSGNTNPGPVCWPVARSHTRTDWSSLPVTATAAGRPSTTVATAFTASVWPMRGLPTGWPGPTPAPSRRRWR